MNFFKSLFQNIQRHNKHQQRQLQENSVRTKNSFQNSLTADDNYLSFYSDPFNDLYLCNAWVNIAVNILIRNVARADFVLERDGVELKNGSLYVAFTPLGTHS